MGPLEEISLALERSWGPVSHLIGVRNTADLRNASAEALPLVIQFGLRLSQSKPIYNVIPFSAFSVIYFHFPFISVSVKGDEATAGE